MTDAGPDTNLEAAPDPRASLATLVENHRVFLRFLERRVGSRETAEDLLQEAFGRAIDRVLRHVRRSRLPGLLVRATDATRVIAPSPGTVDRAARRAGASPGG